MRLTVRLLRPDSKFTTTYPRCGAGVASRRHCFHCGDPLPSPPFYTMYWVKIGRCCCMGCQLASQSIIEAGLKIHLDRERNQRTGSLPDSLYQLQAYDHRWYQITNLFTINRASVVELSINNLRCAACSWLIETQLYRLDGYGHVSSQPRNQRMRVVWDDKNCRLVKFLANVQAIGYDAKPYRQDTPRGDAQTR